MAKSGLKYMLRTGDGKEYGPVDQDTLVQWAENGRVTSDCSIRNLMLKKWTEAEKVSFLDGLVTDPEEMVQREITLADRWWAFLTKTEPVPGSKREKKAKGRGRGIGRDGVFKYDAAGSVLRLGAWLFDWVTVGLVGGLMGGIAANLVQAGVVDQDTAFTGFTVLLVVGYIAYFTLTLAFRAQTFGQWFWGLMIVRKGGDPVLALRALWFTVCHLAFWWSTFIFTIIFPDRRAIQDRLSGTRIIRTCVRQG